MIEAILGVVGKVADKFFPDKDTQLKFQHELALEMMREASKESSEFRDFFIKYEGEYKDLPRSMQLLRASVRPILTYVSMGAYIWGFLHPQEFTPQQMALLNNLLLLMLAFWFGERAVKNLGLVDLLKKGRDV